MILLRRRESLEVHLLLRHQSVLILDLIPLLATMVRLVMSVPETSQGSLSNKVQLQSPKRKMTQNPVLFKFHRHLFRSQVHLKCYHHLTMAIFQISIELNLNAQMNCPACHKEFMAPRKGHNYTPGLELYCHMVCCSEYQKLGECFTPCFVH